ncbi:MAG TPA: hypothetical protein VFJ85_16850 [Acidimicrobiales bacterium]|nr:hypothetical protein [Acidimicrobiales bacterium]
MPDEGVAPDQGLAAVQASAKGWHGIQLAVLGFIGLCGVLQGAGDPGNPRWVRDLAAVLVLGALVLACVAVVVVGSVAWPVRAVGAGENAPERAADRLRTGIIVTFVAVASLATGATSGWWPVREEASGSAAVEVTTGAGVLCGDLVASDPGSVAVSVRGRTVVLSVTQVSSLRPVAACD